MLARVEPDEVEIADGDADTVALFIALDTQWQVHPMTGQRIGLSYMAIAPTAALLGIQTSPAMMGDLRAMELAAMIEFAAAAKRAQR